MSGCVTDKGSYCALYDPIHPTSKDTEAMSDQLVQGVLTNNETYKRVCKSQP